MVRLEHTLERTTTFYYISLKSPKQANVVISRHKDVEVQEILIYFLVKQRKYAFEKYQGRCLNEYSWFVSLASLVVVVGNNYVLALPQLLQLLFKQLPVKEIGMVEIHIAYVSHLLRCTLLIEAV